MANPCKVCKSTWHTAMYHKRAQLKAGKHTNKDRRENAKFRESQRNHEGYLICENCGSWSGSDADHIKKKGSNPHLRYRPDNKQILCRGCHDKKDNLTRGSNIR